MCLARARKTCKFALFDFQSTRALNICARICVRIIYAYHILLIIINLNVEEMGMNNNDDLCH